MRRAVFLTFAYFAALVVCQEYQDENAEVIKTNVRPSMLSMLSKFVELNGTFDGVLQGSMTESYGGVWFNATQRPANGLCEFEETYVEEVAITEKIPYQVEVDVWCWTVRCTEWETRFRDEIRLENVTKTRLVRVECAARKIELVLTNPLIRRQSYVRDGRWNELFAIRLRELRFLENGAVLQSTSCPETARKFIFPFRNIPERCRYAATTSKWIRRQANADPFV